MGESSSYNRTKLATPVLGTRVRKELYSQLTLKKFEKGQFLYFDGDIELLFFKSGKAKAVFYENGEEFILYYLAKDNVYSVQENSVVEFIQESEVYIANYETIKGFHSQPELCGVIFRALTQNTLIERQIIKDLVFESTQKRIASFLLKIALEEHKSFRKSIVIDMDMTVKELSLFIGSKRQTVSTVFNKLIREGVIKKKATSIFTIEDIQRLKELTLE